MAQTKTGIPHYWCAKKNVSLNSKSISNPVAHYIMNLHIHFFLPGSDENTTSDLSALE